MEEKVDAVCLLCCHYAEEPPKPPLRLGPEGRGSANGPLGPVSWSF